MRRWIFSVEYHTGIESLTSGTRRNAFVYTGPLSAEDMYTAYIEAITEVREKMFDALLDSEFEQEEAMKILAERLEGFEFYAHL